MITSKPLAFQYVYMSGPGGDRTWAGTLLKAVAMGRSVAQAQELKDLRAYAELASYYVVTRGGRETSPAELRSILQALRDLLADFAAGGEADDAVEAAFAAARERAAKLGEDGGAWPAASPWGLGALVDQLTSLIAELEAGLGGTRTPRSGWRSRARGGERAGRERATKRRLTR